ncbi:MAG: heavy metal translocating P-type ATPase, partial [Ruminococcus sp.]|nr:heavy metal translocating P-type ATPase [Ruminococcus sp.]
AIMVGTGKAAELGILVKSAEIFEAGSKVKTVMFDKTGTVTEGKPKVTDIITDQSKADSLMEICVAIESMSDHPLAMAISKYKPINSNLKVENFKEITGKGVEATVGNDLYRIGNKSFVSKNLTDSKFTDADAKLSSEGKTPLFVSCNNTVVALIAVADTIKESSSDAIKLLNDSKIKTVMLTGDNRKTAQTIKDRLNIQDAYSELLPADKNEYIRQYQLEGATAMVGDGINDSPALASADIGIALGAGTDIAMQSADVVLVRNDLRDVHTTLHICRKVMKNIKENLFWALIYNTICIPVAAGALYNSAGIMLSPMIGTVAMSLSSICVISNALRLKRLKRTYTNDSGKEIRNMKTVHIEGMACGHCQARVQQLLAPFDENVVVDFTKGTAVIADTVDNDAIISAVTSGGYKVTNID